jgi:cytochrome c oxidase subunit 2
LTKEEKIAPAVPRKRRDVYTGGAALLIAVTIIINILFTGGIAYGVQSMVGGGEDPVEGVMIGGVMEMVDGEMEMVGGVMEFKLSAEQWGYSPAALKVDPGDRVRFIVTSQDIMHGFSINELGVNLALNPGVGIVYEVEIPSDMPEGTYTMYCSIFCGIGHPYMKGNILIGEPSLEIGKILPYVATALMAGMFATFVVIGRGRAQ